MNVNRINFISFGLLLLGLEAASILSVQAQEEFSIPTFPSIEYSSIFWSASHPLKDPLRVFPETSLAYSHTPLPDELEAASTCLENTASHQARTSSSHTSLTLKQAINEALCNNTKVRINWIEINQQAAQVGIARTAYLPTANISLSRLDDNINYSGTNYPAVHQRSNRSSFNLNWRILDFGTRNAGLDSARLQLGAAFASRNETILKVMLQVLQAYTNAQVAQTSLQIQQEMHALALKTLASSERRERLGVGSRIEILQAQTALSRTDLSMSQAEGQWQEAQAALVYLLGLPAGSQLQLPMNQEINLTLKTDQERNAQQMQVMNELDQWLRAAREHHPAIAAAQAEWQAALAKVRATKAEGMPSVDFSFGYYNNGRPTQDITSYHSRESVIGLTLNIPIFDGFSNTYRVRDAQAQADLKRLQYEDTAENTLQELIKIHAQAQAAWRNLLAANSLEQSSIATESSTRRQFDKGATDLLHLLQVQSDLTTARFEQLRARLAWDGIRLELMTIAGAIQ